MSGLIVAAVVSPVGPAAMSVQAQDEEGLFTLAIVAANCQREPTAYSFRGGDCVPAEGAVVTVATTDGKPIGSCTAEDVEVSGAPATCSVPVPFMASLVVTADVSTVPAGYFLTSNPQRFDSLNGAAGRHWRRRTSPRR